MDGRKTWKEEEGENSGSSSSTWTTPRAFLMVFHSLSPSFNSLSLSLSIPLPFSLSPSPIIFSFFLFSSFHLLCQKLKPRLVALFFVLSLPLSISLSLVLSLSLLAKLIQPSQKGKKNTHCRREQNLVEREGKERKVIILSSLSSPSLSLFHSLSLSYSFFYFFLSHIFSLSLSWFSTRNHATDSLWKMERKRKNE